MTANTQELESSSKRTNPSNSGGIARIDAPVGESGPCKILFFSRELAAARNPPPRFKRISTIVAERESTPEGAEGIRNARMAIARDFYSNGGSPIAKYRLARGWSQKKLAEAIGTSQPHIARLEGGREDLFLKTVARLADALNVNPEVLASELMQESK